MIQKAGIVNTELQEQQKRVVQKLMHDNLLIAHGMGSGKTLSSIAAADALGLPVDILTPAPLVENYKKEILKHTKNTLKNVHVRSISQAAQRGYQVDPGGFLVVDEAHAARNPESKRSKYLLEQAKRAGRVALLTGTPTYNDVSDISALMNILHQRQVLPTTKGDFYKEYVEDKSVSPGIWGWVRGVKPGVKQVLKHKKELHKILKDHVDIYSRSEGMPEKREEVVDVEMSPKQMDMYKFVEGTMPWWLRYKIRNNLPPNKAEARNMNAFLSGVRQVSNTPGAFIEGTPPLERAIMSPKLTRAAGEIQRRYTSDPNFRGFVYSNFKDSGVLPMSSLLDRMKIPNAIVHGGLTMRQKKDVVNGYNEGKIKVLLGTSAATEGFDLKGTKLVQILEPHFNNAKLNQAIGRGIRYKSHEHLPPEERNVTVQRFHSQPNRGNLVTKILHGQESGVDKWMHSRAAEKEGLMDELGSLMEAESTN